MSLYPPSSSLQKPPFEPSQRVLALWEVPGSWGGRYPHFASKNTPFLFTFPRFSRKYWPTSTHLPQNRVTNAFLCGEFKYGSNFALGQLQKISWAFKVARPTENEWNCLWNPFFAFSDPPASRKPSHTQDTMCDCQLGHFGQVSDIFLPPESCQRLQLAQIGIETDVFVDFSSENQIYTPDMANAPPIPWRNFSSTSWRNQLDWFWQFLDSQGQAAGHKHCGNSFETPIIVTWWLENQSEPQ